MSARSGAATDAGDEAGESATGSEEPGAGSGTEPAAEADGAAANGSASAPAEVESPRTEPIDRGPARLSSALATLSALVVVGVAGRYALPSLAATAAGALALVAGVAAGRRRAVSLGAAGLVGGALAAGVYGAPPAPLLAGTVAAVVAWDLAGYAVDLGRQLGREADTTRIELVHAGASVGVGAVSAAVGYGVFRAGTGGQPATAVAFAVAAALLLLRALR